MQRYDLITYKPVAIVKKTGNRQTGNHWSLMLQLRIRFAQHVWIQFSEYKMFPQQRFLRSVRGFRIVSAEEYSAEYRGTS